jgi:hypothetical protein
VRTLDEIVAMGRDPVAADELYAQPWFARGFLTDPELVGHCGVLMHAGATTLKMIRECDLIHSVSLRANPRGWRTAWPVAQALRAQIACSLGAHWNLGIRSAARLLSATSDAVSTSEFSDSSGATFKTSFPRWMGQPLLNYANGIAEAGAKGLAAPRFQMIDGQDAVVTLVENEWIFIEGFVLGDWGALRTPVPTARVVSLKSLSTEFKRFRALDPADLPDRQRADHRRAIDALTSPSGTMTLNVSEVLSKLVTRLHRIGEARM